MNKKSIVTLVVIIAAAGLWIARVQYKKTTDKSKTQVSEISENVYWTCSMHPQIHQDHPGECPICHMKLIKVTENKKEETKSGTEEENRASIHASEEQLELIGVQKSTAEKMNLTVKIPVSGHLLSASTVAFYVYEKDLKNIHSGLSFKGETSIDFENDISGTITAVDNLVDPTSRTVRVVGRITKGPSGLLPETSFSGEVQLELKNKLVIPESSVLHTGQGELVYLIDDKNKLTPHFVKLGAKAEGYYEVLKGLSPGDEISSGPNFLIDSEAKLRGAHD